MRRKVKRLTAFILAIVITLPYLAIDQNFFIKTTKAMEADALASSDTEPSSSEDIKSGDIKIDIEKKRIILNGNAVIFEVDDNLHMGQTGYTSMYQDVNRNGSIDEEDCLIASDGDATIQGLLFNYEIYGVLSDETSYGVDITILGGYYSCIRGVKDGAVKYINISVSGNSKITSLIGNEKGYCSGDVSIQVKKDVFITEWTGAEEGIVGGNVNILLDSTTSIQKADGVTEKSQVLGTVKISLKNCSSITVYGASSNSVIKGNIVIEGNIEGGSVYGVYDSKVEKDIDITLEDSVTGYVYGGQNSTIGGCVSINMNEESGRTSLVGAASSTIQGDVLLSLAGGEYSTVTGLEKNSVCRRMGIYYYEGKISGSVYGLKNSSADNGSKTAVDIQIFGKTESGIYGVFTDNSSSEITGDVFIRKESNTADYSYSSVYGSCGSAITVHGNIKVNVKGNSSNLYGCTGSCNIQGNVELTYKKGQIHNYLYGSCGSGCSIGGNLKIDIASADIDRLVCMENGCVNKNTKLAISDSNTKIRTLEYIKKGTVKGNVNAEISNILISGDVLLNSGVIHGDATVLFSNKTDAEVNGVCYRFDVNTGTIKGDCTVDIKQGNIHYFRGNSGTILENFLLNIDYAEIDGYLYGVSAELGTGNAAPRDITICLKDGVYSGYLYGVSGNLEGTIKEQLTIEKKAELADDLKVFYNTNKDNVNGFFNCQGKAVFYGDYAIENDMELDTIEILTESSVYLSSNVQLTAGRVCNHGKLCNQGELLLENYEGTGSYYIYQGTTNFIDNGNISDIPNVYYPVYINEDSPNGSIAALENMEVLKVGQKDVLFGRADCTIRFNICPVPDYTVEQVTATTFMLWALDVKKEIGGYTLTMPEQPVFCNVQYAQKETIDISTQEIPIYVDTIKQEVKLYGTSVVLETGEDGNTNIYLDEDQDGHADSNGLLYSGDLEAYDIIGFEETCDKNSITVTMKSGCVNNICGVRNSRQSIQAITITVEDGIVRGSVLGICNSTIEGPLNIVNQNGQLGNIQVYNDKSVDMAKGGYCINDKGKMTLGGNYEISDSIIASSLHIASDCVTILPQEYKITVQTVTIDGEFTINGEMTAQRFTSNRDLWIMQPGTVTVADWFDNNACLYLKGTLSVPSLSASQEAPVLVLDGSLKNQDCNYVYYPITLQYDNSQVDVSFYDYGSAYIKQDSVYYGRVAGEMSYFCSADAGYEVDTVTYNGKDCSLKKGVYCFTMPAEPVTLKVESSPTQIAATPFVDNPITYVGQEICKETPLYDFSTIQIENDSQGALPQYEIDENSYLPEGLVLEDNKIYGKPEKAYPSGLKVQLKITGNNKTSTSLSIVFYVMETSDSNCTVNDVIQKIDIDTAKKIINLNGISVIFKNGSTDRNNTTIYLDQNHDGEPDSMQAVTIAGSSQLDLSAYSVYGVNSGITCEQQSITFAGGKLWRFIGVGENGSLNGDLSLTIQSGSVTNFYGTWGETAQINGNLKITNKGNGEICNFYGMNQGTVQSVNLNLQNGIYTSDAYLLSHAIAEDVEIDIEGGRFAGDVYGSDNSQIGGTFDFTAQNMILEGSIYGCNGGSYKDVIVCMDNIDTAVSTFIKGILDAQIEGDATLSLNIADEAAEEYHYGFCNSSITGNAILRIDEWYHYNQLTAFVNGTVAGTAVLAAPDYIAGNIVMSDGADLKNAYSICNQTLDTIAGTPELLEDISVTDMNVKKGTELLIPSDRSVTVAEAVTNEGNVVNLGYLTAGKVKNASNATILNRGHMTITDNDIQIAYVFDNKGKLYNKGELQFMGSKVTVTNLANAYYFAEIESEEKWGTYELKGEYDYLEYNGVKELYICAGREIQFQLSPKEGHSVREAKYYCGGVKNDLEAEEPYYVLPMPYTKVICIFDFSGGQYILTKDTDSVLGTVGVESDEEKPLYDLHQIEIKQNGLAMKPTAYSLAVDSVLPEGLQLKDGKIFGTPEKAYVNGKEILICVRGEGETSLYFCLNIEIEKGIPKYEIPQNIEVEQGSRLSDVMLPDYFAWKDSSQQFNQCGEQMVYAKYQYDTNNYQVAEEIPVWIKVRCKVHSFTAWEVIRNAGCNEPGKQQRICSVCGYTEQEEIITQAHKWSVWEMVNNPGCETAGLKKCRCNTCGAVKTQAVEALGHYYNTAYTTDREPTCTQSGSRSMHCLRDNCDAVVNQEDIPMTGHSHGATKSYISPTCEEMGTQKYYCEICKEWIEEKVPALGHSYSAEWKIEEKASVEKTGIKCKPCTREDCTDMGTTQIIPQMKYSIQNGIQLYDGMAHSIEIEVETPGNARVLYSEDGIQYETVRPTYTKAGSYTIYYKIEAEEYETCSGEAKLRIFQSQGSSVDDNTDTTEQPGNEEMTTTENSGGEEVTTTEDTGSGEEATTTEDMESGEEATTTEDTESGEEATTTEDTESGEEATTTEDTGSGEEATTTEDMGSGEEATTTEDTGSGEEATTTEDTESGEEATTTEAIGSGEKAAAEAISTTQIEVDKQQSNFTENIPDKVKKGVKFNNGGIRYQVIKVSKNSGYVAATACVKKTAKRLVIPDTVTYQGQHFQVTVIGKKAFKNNKKLTAITIGSNITDIQKDAFMGCSNLKKIVIKSTKLKKIGKNAYKNIAAKAVFTIPKSKKEKYRKLLSKYKNYRVRC